MSVISTASHVSPHTHDQGEDAVLDRRVVVDGMDTHLGLK